MATQTGDTGVGSGALPGPLPDPWSVPPPSTGLDTTALLAIDRATASKSPLIAIVSGNKFRSWLIATFGLLVLSDYQPRIAQYLAMAMFVVTAITVFTMKG